MKALFVHDHKFTVDKNGTVLSHLMDGILWSRYLEHCDSLTVLARKIMLDPDDKRANGLRPAACDNVDFILMGEEIKNDGSVSSGPGIKSIAETIKQAVQESDTVIARLPSIFGYLACREAIKQKKKYAVEVVACAWDSNFYHGNPKNRIMALPSLMIMKHYVKRADAAIYVTDEYLQSIYPCKGMTGVASNVVVDMPQEDILDAKIKKIDNIDDRKMIFGLVGSMAVNFKGHDTAMRSLAAAKDRIPDFELHFIGDGDSGKWQRFAYEQGIGDKVFFDGLKKSGQEVIGWMDSLDILLIPSLQEGLPRALIEAMSRGLPALGAITGGIPQLLDGDYLHKKKDYRKLSEDIVRLCNNKDEMKCCAETNFNRVRRFDSEILKKHRYDFWKSFFNMSRKVDKKKVITK